ncbi:hypothetical protein QE152_g22265 [Popillia japonica]|uniref:Uncharacterized protein n=1 Tax=Popillia japonica TaxID=7064 RepID=A0AAW1KJB3_POPJA
MEQSLKNAVQAQKGQRQAHILRGSIGTLVEYRIGNDWIDYVEEDRKVAVLLTVIGDEAYLKIRDELSELKVDMKCQDLDFAELKVDMKCQDLDFVER